jgi:hypothetical protein
MEVMVAVKTSLSDRGEMAVKLSGAIVQARATARNHRIKAKEYEDRAAKPEEQLQQLIDNKSP